MIDLLEFNLQCAKFYFACQYGCFLNNKGTFKIEMTHNCSNMYPLQGPLQGPQQGVHVGTYYIYLPYTHSIKFCAVKFL